MKKKLGPLAVWQWALIVGGLLGIYYLYKKKYAGAAGTSATTNTTPNAGVIDPTTGLPFSGSTSGTSDLSTLEGSLGTLGQLNAALGGIGLGIQPVGQQAPVSGGAGPGPIDPTITGSNPVFDPTTGGGLDNLPLIIHPIYTSPQTNPTGTLGAALVASSTGQGSKIHTHKNGPFYNYYKRVTGHAPPSVVDTTNVVYEMWKSGVKVAAAKATSSGTNMTHGSTNKANPGNTVKTHTGSGKRTAATNNLGAGHGAGKNTSPPNHQKQSSYTPTPAAPVAAPAGNPSQQAGESTRVQPRPSVVQPQTNAPIHTNPPHRGKRR